jgi:hypothetical protein
LDSSTDKAGLQELILYVRYITDNKVEDISYQSLPSSVLLQMDIFKLSSRNWISSGSNWLSSRQLIGTGTDGAASFIGVEMGLYRKIVKI